MNPRFVIALLLVLAVGSCQSATAPVSLPSDSSSAEMMATALTELVTRDHTFGLGAHVFSLYLIEVDTVPISLPPTPDSPDSRAKSSDTHRPLTDLERTAIETAISKVGPVQWIEDRAAWQVGLEPVVEGSVILGVDFPRLDEHGGLVPVSLWCGGDCGTWLTYRLELIDQVWQVTGKEGPVAVS